MWGRCWRRIPPEWWLQSAMRYSPDQICSSSGHPTSSQRYHLIHRVLPPVVRSCHLGSDLIRQVDETFHPQVLTMADATLLRVLLRKGIAAQVGQPPATFETRHTALFAPGPTSLARTRVSQGACGILPPRMRGPSRWMCRVLVNTWRLSCVQASSTCEPHAWFPERPHPLPGGSLPPTAAPLTPLTH